MHWNLFWVTQNGNFVPGKSISRREKIKKNDFAPQKNFPAVGPSYAPGPKSKKKKMRKPLLDFCLNMIFKQLSVFFF